MSVYQLSDRCWVFENPGHDDDTRHFEDSAAAGAALCRAREDKLETKESVRQLPSPCWLVQCDECEQVIDEEDEGITFHHESRAEALETIRLWDWVLVPGHLGGELAYCPGDRPEGVAPPAASAADLVAAGQQPLPGAPGRKLAPHELWEQAKGDPGEYRRLMREHGHLVGPGDPGYDPDAPKTLPCGWPGSRP
jgi:hypothetical protein